MKFYSEFEDDPFKIEIYVNEPDDNTRKKFKIVYTKNKKFLKEEEIKFNNQNIFDMDDLEDLEEKVTETLERLREKHGDVDGKD